MPGSKSSAPTVSAADAVTALLRSHGSKLHGLALRMCGNAADAEDMVQDVFLQAFRKWHTFRGEANPATWLYSIAARSCKARLHRKGGVDRRVPALSQLMPWSETTVMHAAVRDDARVERDEAIQRVQHEIARLPEYLRVPLVFRDVLQMPTADVAEALGLEEGTIKTRVHRARLALRKAMTAKARGVVAPAPIYEKQVCLDLLKAKLDAMDRGDGSTRIPQAEVCDRCRAVFRELDLVKDACARMHSAVDGPMPDDVRTRIANAIARRDAAERAAAKPRRGRKPKPSATSKNSATNNHSATGKPRSSANVARS